jgi:hypothetical protein
MIEKCRDVDIYFITFIFHIDADVAVGLLIANCEHKYVMSCLLPLSLQVEVQKEGRMLRCVIV